MKTLEEMVVVLAKLVNEVSYSEFSKACTQAGINQEDIQQVLEVLDEVGN
jgi:hypothetical protein